MARKPFENKKAYDPGRLRHKVDFVLENSTDDGFGGTTVTTNIVLSTFAGRDKINQFNQMVIDAGATVFNGDTYFVIRNRKDFYPTKDMKVVNSEDSYTIHGIVDLDYPVTFIQLLCVRSR